MSCSKVLFIKMIQLKVLKILSKTPLTKENKCQMLPKLLISVSSFFFLKGVTTFRKLAISFTLEKMIPLQLVIFHLTFTPKCLDRKFISRAACQRSHSNERHITHLPECRRLHAGKLSTLSLRCYQRAEHRGIKTQGELKPL